MPEFEPNRGALLVEPIHRQQRSTLAACLDRWSTLLGEAHSGCYLVVEGDEPGHRVTLDSLQIERLAQVARHAQWHQRHAPMRYKAFAD